MSQKLRLLELFEGKHHQKNVLAASVMVLIILELVIFLVCAANVGDKSRVIVTDNAGNKVYESQGTALSSYERMVFEKDHGPLRDFTVQLQTVNVPFPFRAWISSAVGIPVGLVLLMAFLVRAFLSLLYGEEKETVEEGASGACDAKQGRFASLSCSFRHISIFNIGLLVVVAVLLLWMVPNFLGDFADLTMKAIREYKFFFLGTAVFLALLIVWIIYLRYRLSKQMLENQMNIEKFRVEKQLLLYRNDTPLLPDSMDETQKS